MGFKRILAAFAPESQRSDVVKPISGLRAVDATPV
jgi:hypothetical protein